MKKILLVGLATGALLVVGTQSALAAQISWTDWTSLSTASSGVLGTLDVSGTNVGVTFTGAYDFAQTSGGTNYWNPSDPYISATVGNAPPASDIIALGSGGQKTITFSQAVLNPIIALVSWNGNTVDFGVPITILDFGQGFWGDGTPIRNPGGTGFFGSGEVHGIIELRGSYNSITFTDSNESWHGFTVGVPGLSSNVVPEPTTMLLFGAGIAGLAAVGRKKRS